MERDHPPIASLAACLAVAGLALVGCGSGDRPTAPGAGQGTGAKRPTKHGWNAAPAASDREVSTAVARLIRLRRPVYCGGRRRYAALTFDDGPGPYTRKVLAILRAEGIPATFFINGRKIAGRRRAIRAAAARSPGTPVNALQNHSWSHLYMPALTARETRSELSTTARLVRGYSGRPVTLFRPPYGATNPTIAATARKLGMIEILWSVDSEDALGADWRGITRNVRAGLGPGAIILMHDNRGQTLRALRYHIVPALRHRRLKFVTVPQLLALNPPTTAQLRAGPRGCRYSGRVTVSGGGAKARSRRGGRPAN